MMQSTVRTGSTTVVVGSAPLDRDDDDDDDDDQPIVVMADVDIWNRIAIRMIPLLLLSDFDRRCRRRVAVRVEWTILTINVGRDVE